ncbi:hypothetical protein JCGZ_19393 [Jatropha curcas]|uniref:Uncharacterized protein n=1 Tax=Jatropha curcas TaxID=180498 RepID=A0A067KAL2_JATCU|nr:hypothetical protein JCGZ_19393 [Jatropha curcas]
MADEQHRDVGECDFNKQEHVFDDFEEVESKVKGDVKRKIQFFIGIPAPGKELTDEFNILEARL